MPASAAPMLMLEPLDPLFFFPLRGPERRLTSIMATEFSRGWSGDLPERQPDREHQERCDLVSDERFEGAVTYLHVRQRVGLLHRKPQASPERLVEPRDARAAAAGEDGAQLPGARRRREERRGALDAGGDLLAAA